MSAPTDTNSPQTSPSGGNPPSQASTGSASGAATQKTKTATKERAKSERKFLKEILLMAHHLDIEKLLFVFGAMPPFDDLKGSKLKRIMIIATASEKIGARCEEEGIAHEIIPGYAFERFEKVKVALGACVSSGLLVEGMRVLCAAGKPNSSDVDTCMLTRIGDHAEERAALGVLVSGEEANYQVLETVLNLALAIGFEGFEGAPVGTIFVLGDSTAVMEKSRQLTLNPFQGYSEDEKNILDPRVRDAIRNYALLDGAIIVREDGVVLAAGRYLKAAEEANVDLPLGLGTRNAAAMAITKVTKALAFLISKTNGAVRIYKEGALAVELKQLQRRMLMSAGKGL